MRKEFDPQRYPDSKITGVVIEEAYRVSRDLGYGFLEKVYENPLALVLRERGISTSQQMPLKVLYRGQVIGDFVADLLIEDRIVIELKAARCWDSVFDAQLLNYLRASGRHTGLIINFGAARLQYKRMVLSQPRSSRSSVSVLDEVEPALPQRWPRIIP